MAQPYPFSALVGQDAMIMGLILVAVDPRIGGVLIMGDRGTGKSTAVRAMAGLLPKIEVVVGCPYAAPPIHRGGHALMAARVRLNPQPLKAGWFRCRWWICPWG